MGREHDGHESPEGIELPHVAEVAERRRAKRSRAEDHGDRAWIEFRALREIRPVGYEKQHEDATRGCNGRYRDGHRFPRQRLTPCLEKMGQCRSEHERT